MKKIYSTQELIQILADERRACLNGQRFNLAVTTSGINPFIDTFLKPDGLQKFTAYQDFKATVHSYQREHQVSGIVWRHLAVKGKTLSYPEVDEQLIAVSSDLEVLKAAKHSILVFWREVTVQMDLYLSVNAGKDHWRVQPAEVEALMERTEWAGLCKAENSNFLEIILQLGWGKPEEASYRRGWPVSDSKFIHAVNPGSRPIC